MPTAGSTPGPTLASRLIGLVNRHGSPGERKLVAAAREGLHRFLDHPELGRPQALQCLEVTLENRNALAFTYAPPSGRSRYALIDNLGEWASSLRAPSEEIIRGRMHAHASICLTPEGTRFSLRVLAGRGAGLPDTLLRLIGAAAPPPGTGEVRAMELDSAGLLRLLVASEPSAVIRTRLGRLPDGANCDGLQVLDYQSTSRSWIFSHALVVVAPFPSYLLNARLIDGRPGFAYLLTRGGTRSHALLRLDPEREALTTPLLPQPAKGAEASA
jgi:hypothetical protein